MTRLVQKAAPEPASRLWLVFFSETGAAWWTRVFKPGFRHVSAAAWFDDQQRWVCYDPARNRTAITLYSADEFGPRFAQMLALSSAVLRVPSRAERGAAPAVFFCVGAIKALLGLRSRALTPRGLFRQLVRNGAEIVEVPGVRPILVKNPATAGRGPGGEAPA